MDVLTVSNALGTNPLGANAAQGASPVTIDAVFGALLESMSDSASAAAIPQMPDLPAMGSSPLFVPPAAAPTQTASLASIVSLMQNGSDVTGEGTSDQSPFQTTYQANGALVVPASTLSDDTDSDTATETVAPQTPFIPAPQPAKPTVTTAAANLPTDQTDDVAAQPAVPAAQTDGDETTQTIAAPVAMPVPAQPAKPAVKDAAPQQVDKTPASDDTQVEVSPQPQDTAVAPVKPQTSKTAAAPQPNAEMPKADTSVAMASPVQVAPVKLQTAAPSDDDAVPANSDSSDSDTDKTCTEQQPAQTAPAPVAVAVPVPAPAAPVQSTKPANDSVAPVTMAAPKPQQSDTPDDAAAQDTSTGKPAAREASQHPAAKAEPQTKSGEQPAPSSDQPKASDQPQTSALRSVPDATPSAHTNSATPQPDVQTAAPQHQTPAPSAVPVINPALAQSAPSGLRKLTTGLQIAAQEQDTTSTFDKIGVSIVTKAVEGLRHFDIRLDPPELGRVEVRLTVDDSGKAQASLIVDKPQTLELLQRDQTNLNRALSDAGLDLSNNGLNFSLKEQDRQNDGGMDQGRGRHLSAKAVVQTDITPVHSSLGSYAPDSVRLDIRV